MPVDPAALTRITALGSVPEAGRGLVRDLPVRWALEEAGIPYSARTLTFLGERSADDLAEQPFGQVPAYNDGEVSMFESGAIVLRVGERSEALLPRDPRARAKTISWLFAALSSVEMQIWPLALLNIFFADKPWRNEARPALEGNVRRVLGRVAAHLGEKDWLEGEFTAGDLMMVTVLRRLRSTGLVAEHANLAAYLARGEARPAFQRALAAHLADFADQATAA
jgi:glutathione S-transferase